MVFRENLKEFYRSFKLSLVPHKYRRLMFNSGSEALNYLLTLVVFSIIFMFLVSTPSLIALHQKLVNESDNVEKVEMNFDISLIEPIIIGVKNPQIIIDVTGEYTELGDEGQMVITDQLIDYKFLGFKNRVTIADLQNLAANNKLVNSVFFILLFFLPSLLIWLFVAQFLKYLVLIVIMALVGWFFANMMRFRVSFNQSLIVAVYASTLLVIMDTILLPFNLGSLVLQIPIFLNYGISLLTFFIALTIYIIAMIMIGSKEFRER